MSNSEEANLTSMMKLLRRFDPLSNLNESNLAQVAKGASSFKLSKRQKLLAADEHRWLVYLVSGVVQGKDVQGEVFSLRPAAREQMALFDAQPRPVEITVTEDAQFLRVDRKQFSVLMNEQISSSTLVEEIDLDDNDAALFDSLVETYQQGALKLPLNDSVINTVGPLLANSSAGTDNVLLEVMRAEPALALVIAYVAATSGSYKAGELSNFRRLIDMVSREQLITELSQWGRDNPFPEAGTFMYQRIVTAYDYLRRVGAFSRAIAAAVPGVDAEHAEFVGICSKVGLISGWLMNAESTTQPSENDDAALTQLAPLMTEMLLGQLRVDSEVTSSVDGVNSGEAGNAEINVSDVVRVAVTYLPIDIFGEPVGLAEDEKLMARFSQVGIGLRELDMILEKCDLDSASSLRMAS